MLTSKSLGSSVKKSNSLYPTYMLNQKTVAYREYKIGKSGLGNRGAGSNGVGNRGIGNTGTGNSCLGSTETVSSGLENTGAGTVA